HVVGQPGELMHFSAFARDGQNLPLTLSLSDQPATAAFNAETGEFTWLPTPTDAGRHQVTFAAADAAGGSVKKTVILAVESGAPRINALRNSADASDASSCSAGAIARVTGTFLQGTTRVLINGSEARMLSTASDHIDFLCPMLDPGKIIDIAAETASA